MLSGERNLKGIEDMKRIILLIWTGVFILTACSVGEGSSRLDPNATLAPVPEEFAGLSNPFGTDAAAVAAGAEVFRTNCETCHGARGRGDGPAGQSLNPPPGDLARLQSQVSDDYLFWRIHDGKPGTAMVAWKGILTDEQIWQAVSFIRTLEE